MRLPSVRLSRVWLMLTFQLVCSSAALAQTPPEREATAPLATSSSPSSAAAAPVSAPHSLTLLAPNTERALQEALDTRYEEQRRLTLAGRPAHYVRRRVLGFVAIGTGAFSAGMSALAAYLICVANRCGLSQDGQAALWTFGGTGLATLGVGIWAVTSAKRNNLYRERIVQLEHELGSLKRQLRKTQRGRTHFRQYSLLPVLQADRRPRAGLGFTMTW